jgi:hypothetical protein
VTAPVTHGSGNADRGNAAILALGHFGYYIEGDTSEMLWLEDES